MVRPYTVSLELFRGAAYSPYARLNQKVLASSILEACSKAETSLNVVLGDVEYAAATDAHPVWEPRPAVPSRVLAHAA